MGGGIIGSIVMSAKSKSTSHIAVVSRDQQLATDLQHELENGKDSKMTVDVISPPGRTRGRSLTANSADKALDGYLWITPGSQAKDRPTFAYTPRSAGDIVTKGTVSFRASLRSDARASRPSGHGRFRRGGAHATGQVDTTQAGKNADTTSAFIGAYVLFFLMYFVIMLYGMNVARSIIEEKTSRIFEVLLATIRPEEMMAGKVIGVGFSWAHPGRNLADNRGHPH